METGVYFKLVDLRNRFGEQVLGQICQDLLALSFVKIGCNPASISAQITQGLKFKMLLNSEQLSKTLEKSAPFAV
jgi:hypothetical protein